MASKRKYNELTIEKKKEIIDRIERGSTCRQLANAYHIDPKIVSNISKQKQLIIDLWEKNCTADRRRKWRSTDFDDINHLAYNFFVACRANGIPISRPILQSKAKIIADAIGLQEFIESNGWLESFLARHNIVLQIMNKEVNAIDSGTAET